MVLPRQRASLKVISARVSGDHLSGQEPWPENGAAKGDQFLKVRCSKVTIRADIVHCEWRVVCDVRDVLSDVQMQRSTQHMEGQAGWV